MPTVLVYRNELLPPSETFIQAQAASLRRYTPHFVGLRQTTPSLLHASECHLAALHRRLPALLHAQACDYVGLQPALLDRRFLDGLRALRPALLHAHFATDALTARPLAKALGIPMLVTLHGYDVTARTPSRNPLRVLLRALRRSDIQKHAALFLCVSEFIRTKALEEGFPAHKLLVHRIGIDLDAFQPGPLAAHSLTVLFVGRLTEKKGCAYLIRAMAEVQRHLPAANLVVIGEGPLRASLEALATQHNVRCSFLGRQNQSAVRTHIAAARVCAVPSVTAANGDSEGLPMFLAEAQALGVPVVGTRHAGIPEGIVDGGAGMLSVERDVDGLAANILRVLGDDRLHADLGRRGIELMQREFDLHTQTQLLEAFYDTIATGATAQAKSFRSAPATAW